jgi:RND family efflux transporter MFP subunit
MRNVSKWAALGVVGLGLLGSTVIQAWGPASPVPAGSPAKGDLPGSAVPSPVAAEGRVVAYPGAEIKVGVERAGRVVRVRVQEGDAVKKGDLLAEIESEELRAGLAESKARVHEAEAELRMAELNLDRRQKLVDQGIVAVHDRDQATRDIDIARARRETALATVARYEAQIRKSYVLAPITGHVIARRIDAGQTAEAGDAAFTLADLGRVRIEGEAHEADAGQIALGAPVVITAEGYPGKSWKGRVEEIPDAVTLRRLKPQDPSRPTDTRILAVKVAFAQPNPLKLGTTVELKIDAR